jgi:hypothetical protein
MNCPKILELIKESEVLHTQALMQIEAFSDTHFRMRAVNDLNIFTELRRINTEYENLKKQMSENIKQIESLLNPQINIHYTYTNPETKTEYQEDIHIDIEQQIQEHIAFYNQTNIDIPPNFQETVLDIWNRNYTEIQSQIEQFGFNGVLIVPGNIPLETLFKNMNTPDGEENDNQPHKGFYLGDNFKNAGGISTCISIGTDKPRIILYHKKTLPEIQEQNGVDVHLNITAQDAQSLYEQNPSHYLGTLEDLIILERITYKPKTRPQDTDFHISNWNTKSACWLPDTKQQGSSRFVYCFWDPVLSALYVDANDALYSHLALGCRPSRYFI